MAWLAVFRWQPHMPYIIVLYYVMFVFMELLQFLIIMDYSSNKRRDVSLLPVIPLMPVYQLYQRFVTTWAILEEILHRRSFKDGFVPKHVRDVTWHW